MIHRLTIICFVAILVEVLSQGGGGGHGGGGGGGSGSGTRKGCSGPDCWRDFVKHIAYGVILISTIVGICVALSRIAACIKRRAFKKRLKRLKTEQSGNESTIPINIQIIFESGQWSAMYFQYKGWNGPSNLQIDFNIDGNTLNGYGTDDIGQYNLTGDISTQDLTVNMIKKYISGTGDKQENLGHDVKIDLKWSKKQCAFTGNWSVDTSTYTDHNKYILTKLPESSRNQEKDSPV